MGLMTDAAVVNIEGNTKQLVDQINKADKAMQNFDKTLTDILSHLTAVENGLKSVNTVTNNAAKISNNVQARYNRETYDFGKQAKISKSSAGFMSSNTGREKTFREYQQAVINETKEITADIAERKRLRKQRADAETTTANAAKTRASKLEDQTSARYLARMDKLADARLLNAKANQAGALYRDPRYQAGKAFSAVGNTVSSWGVGGKAAGLLLDSLGAFVKSPVAGTAVAVSNLVKGVSDLGKASTQAFAEIEAIKTQMGVVYSSQTQANSAFGEISQYAVKSPFGIQQTSELAILLKQSGVYASDLMNTLRMLGDTAGGNMEKMKRIANNYAQIMAIGKASMLDMRQFAYAGIPIFEAVSKELSVSQQELRKLISDGKVTSDIIEKVFKDLTGINGIFENATAKGAKTLKARLQNLSDARQLAFASIGEDFYNIGSQTGNDSYANRIVSVAENIWQGLHDWFDRGNIAKNVEIIANRNDRIEELKQLIEYNKDNKELRKLLENELKEELSKRDIEKERATYVSSYDAKAGRFTNALAALNGYSIDDAYGRRSSLLWKDSLIGLFNNRQEYNNLNNEQSSKLFGLYNELIKSLEELSRLTAEDIQANRERNVLQAQQLAYDQINHYANSRGSLNNAFQELSSIYKASDKYKEKEEKEHLATLKNALEVLKDIAKNTDESGRVDITKFSANQLASYIRQGAFTSGEKLNVVTGDKSIDSQNRQTLMNQYGYIVKLTDNFLKTGMSGVVGIQGTTYAQSFNQEVLDSLKELSDEQFYTEFPKIYEQQSNAINEMLRVAPKDGRQQQLEVFKNLLDYALNKIEADTTGTEADPNDILKGSTQEFIPLWKRILSSATGLTTNGMTSTQQTMTNYRDDMAIRNMASGVLSATMKSMGIDTAMSLMRTNRSVQLTGDNGKTYQIDWAATKKAMKDFATQLSASTEVVTAYKNGLQAELDTYEQLIAAGYTQAESTDLGSQKFVSSKQLAKLGLGNESQLVNAFGEVLTTASGKKYNVADVSFKEGKMYDKLGNEIQEEVVITGKLFEFIKEQMPRLREELHEATAAELNNKLLNNLWNQISGSSYMMKYAHENGYTERTALMLQNPDYVQAYLESAIKTLRTNKYKGEYEGSDQDVIMRGVLAQRTINKLNHYIEEVRNSSDLTDSEKASIIADLNDDIEKLRKDSVILDDAFKDMDKNVRKITNSGMFGDISQFAATSERDNAVLNELSNIAQLLRTEEYNAKNPDKARRLFTDSGELITSATQLKPEDYAGKRGLNNGILKFFFGGQDFDLEDLYRQAAQTKNIEGKDVNQFGIDATKFEDMDPEKIVENLTDAEKAMIKTKSALIDMVHVFGEFKDSVSDLTREIGKKAFITPFEKMGECLASSKTWTDETGKAMEQLGAEAMNALGPLMQQAGFALIEYGAKNRSMGLIAGGLALAAAGGFASGIGNALSSSEKDDDNDKETEKLESLKDDLVKLLEQARSDALYYEHNLRHKTALGINKGFSHQSVNDAIITPQGKVVTTDPKDYLIATKTPNQLVGGAPVNVTPVINCNVVNNSSSRVTQQQRQNADGSIDIITMIEDAVGEYISSPRSDEAFESREYRLSSKQAVM